MSQNLATVDRPRRDIVVQDPVPVMDSDRFAMMQRIASVMASGSLVPESLTHVKLKGANDATELPYERVLANCFLVVNQAVRWGLDPFAVSQCVSVVHGKLCYEGKLVSAVIEAKLGVRLRYEWNDKTGDAFGIKVSGQLPDGGIESIDGTVGDWKTTGNNSPWGKPSNHKRMLAYRGAREWARLFASGIMLGVYSDDEMADLADEARARRATQVGPSLASRLAAAPSPSIASGFSAEGVDREIGGETVDSATGEITTNSKPAATSGQATQGGADQENESSQTETSTETVAGPSAGQGTEEAAPTSSQPDAAHPSPPSDQDSNGASSGDGAADPGGSAVSPSSAAVTTYPYGDYARALARAPQPKSLSSFDQQFRNMHGWTTDEAALPTLRLIFAAHQKKLRGEMKPAEFAAEIKRLGAAA